MIVLKETEVWNHADCQAWKNYASVLVCHNIDVWRILHSYSKEKSTCIEIRTPKCFDIHSYCIRGLV